MSIVTLSLIVMACAALTSTAPAEKVNSMDLEQVLSASVCPIVVHYDYDKHRIPRRIKTLKCGQTPNPMCQLGNIKNSCCRNKEDKVHTECVNVVDHVMVRYTNRGDDTMLHKHRVHVGCTCMIREEAVAIEDS